MLRSDALAPPELARQGQAIYDLHRHEEALAAYERALGDS
jgi:hypothetical protein